MKLVKRLTALFLAIVMTMAMGITAFAEETPDEKTSVKYTITISQDAGGYQYQAYKLFSGSLATIDGKKTLGDIEWADATIGAQILAALKSDALLKDDFKDAKTAADVAKIVATYSSDKDGVADDKLVQFADIAGKKLTAVAGTSGGWDSTNKQYTITNLDPGYYIVKNNTVPTGKTYSRFLLNVVDDVTVTPKVKPVDIDKNIIDNTIEKDGESVDDPNKALDYDTNKGGGKTDTAAIGDTIEFEITGTVPDYTGYEYYYYVVKDTMSKGLALDKDFNDKTGFKVVVSWTDADGKSHEKTLAEATSVPTDSKSTEVYYVQTGENANDGSNSFELSFENIKQYPIGASISVKYQATVTKDAVVGVDENGNPVANTNKARVEYSNKPEDSGRGDKDNKPGFPNDNKPKGETPEYTTKTYVTELNLIKVDQDGMPLKGAEFTLTGTNLNQVIIRTEYVFAENEKGTYYQLTNGTYTETAPTENKYEGEGEDKKLVTKSNYTSYKDATSNDNGNTVTVSKKYVRTVKVSTETNPATATNRSVVGTVNDNGFVTFTGLNAGSYTLTETKTPDGYNTIQPISFEIIATNEGDEDPTHNGGSVTFSEKVAKDKTGVLFAEGNTFKITIKNIKGSILPSTGGMGTTVIYVAGIAMIVVAGIVIIARKRFA